MAAKTDRLSVFCPLVIAAVLFPWGSQRGDGGKQPRQVPTKAQQAVKDIDARLLLIQPGTGRNGGVVFGSDQVFTLTPQDAEAIVKECPAVVAAAPIIRVRTEVSHKKQKWVPLFIYGTTPSFLQIRSWQTLAEGRPFSDQEVRGGGTVCLLGATVARELFGEESPLGKEVRVGNGAFKVIGVLSKKGQSAVGLDQDDILLAPWTTIKSRLKTALRGASSDPKQTADAPKAVPSIHLDQILAQARSVKDVEMAVRQVRELLRQRHKIAAGQPDDFLVRDMRELLKAISGPRP
ncbi:MAG TPA: ABC transporter permease [Gemmataceae bacterium]|nr:ABC transporter permease [Gemmataceae bacterium]